MKFVKMAELDGLMVGVQTTQLAHKGQRLGPILIDADNRKQLEKRISSIQEMLRIEVEGYDGSIKGITWN